MKRTVLPALLLAPLAKAVAQETQDNKRLPEELVLTLAPSAATHLI
jgi:hypothetical protein